MPRLPAEWPNYIKSGLIHAVALAGVAITEAQARLSGRHQLRARLDQAQNEIQLLREELAIKDGRWRRAQTRRRPHYTPTHRFRILALRAARGWTLQKSASIFLVDLHTLQLWVRRVDEHGDSGLLQTSKPVNRYPDYFRELVRHLTRTLPTMGAERMAQIIGRLGLWVSASSVRRFRAEPAGPDRQPDATHMSKRRAVGRCPGDVWHVDLTAVPTRAGLWVPWKPLALPQLWPFCWWVLVIVDQVSREFVGFAYFRTPPNSGQVQAVLARAIRKKRRAPRCIVTDKGTQFKCRSFRRWAARRTIRVQHGHLGEPCSIPIVERFIRTMKQECFRQLAVAAHSEGVARRELAAFAIWYNAHRPQSSLGGRTPLDVIRRRKRAARIKPRLNWPHRSRHQLSRVRIAADIGYVEGKKHLPVVSLRRAA